MATLTFTPIAGAHKPAHERNPMVVGPMQVMFGQFTLLGNYVTGGDALPTDVTEAFKRTGEGRVFMVQCNPTSGFMIAFNHTTDKLQLYVGDNDNAADAEGVEVANGVALGVKLLGVPCVIWGN